MENSNQKTQQQKIQQLKIKQKQQEQETKRIVEEHIKEDIKNHDLLNLSCSIKKTLDDFVNQLNKEKIPICFMTKVVKCDKTNNFFLTVQIFKDLEEEKKLKEKQKQLEEQENNSNYDAKTIRNKIVSLIKKKYKNKDISVFESEEIHNESIPNCKVYYDCFEVNKEFRNEIVKTWMLRAMLAAAVGLGIYTGAIGVVNVIQFFGLTKLMNYNIVSRARTFANEWWNKTTNWFTNTENVQNNENSMNNFIINYIDKDFVQKYQDFGTIRVIFNRELQDYADIVNIYYENIILEKNNRTVENGKEDEKKLVKCIEVIKTNVNLMNHQLKYFENSKVNLEFTDSQWDLLKKKIPTIGNLVTGFIKVSSTIFQYVKSSIRTAEANKKIQQQRKRKEAAQQQKRQEEKKKILEYLKSEPIKLIDCPDAYIKLLRIRKDMLIFDIFEYLKVCFKNFNYDIDIGNVENVEDNRVQIYVNESDTFYSYFKINFKKPISSPYVYVQSIENNKNVLLTNAATSTTKRLSLQQFKQKYTKPLKELKKQEAQRVRFQQQKRKESERLEKQEAQQQKRKAEVQRERVRVQQQKRKEAERLERQKAQRVRVQQQKRKEAERLERQKAQQQKRKEAEVQRERVRVLQQQKKKETERLERQKAQRVRKEAEQLKKKQIQTLLQNLNKQSFFQLYKKYPDHQYNKQHSQKIKEFLERQTNKMFKGKVGNQYEMVDKRIRKKIQRQEAQLIQKYKRLVGTQSNQNNQQENLVRQQQQQQQQQNSRKNPNQQEKQFSDKEINKMIFGDDSVYESSSDESYEYDPDNDEYDSDNDEIDSDEIEGLYGNNA